MYYPETEPFIDQAQRYLQVLRNRRDHGQLHGDTSELAAYISPTDAHILYLYPSTDPEYLAEIYTWTKVVLGPGLFDDYNPWDLDDDDDWNPYAGADWDTLFLTLLLLAGLEIEATLDQLEWHANGLWPTGF